jgi:hypothetical protein
VNTKHINMTNRSRTDETIIHFPGGSVQVTRRTDGQGYWAHISRDRHANTGEPSAIVTNVRVDCEGMNTNDANAGDMARADFYHVAVCITPGGQS